MGCGASGVNFATGASLSDQLSILQKEKESLYAESRDVERELATLKKSTAQVTIENEILKQELSRDITKLFPQVFQSADLPEELIEEWLDLDLYEGDRHLSFFEIVHPAAAHLLDEVKSYSSANKTKETSLKEYIEYFKFRYDQIGRTLGLMGEAKIQLDDCVKSVKEHLVSNIKVYEVQFGKKSTEVDQLSSAFVHLQTATGPIFIEGMKDFYETTLRLYINHYEAKLQAAAEARKQLKAQHNSATAALQQQHKEDLQEKDRILECVKQNFKSRLRKQLDESRSQRAGHLDDLDNQLMHFDAHFKKLRATFDKEQAQLRFELETVIAQLKREITTRDAVIREKEETILKLDMLVSAQYLSLKHLEVVRGENETKIKELTALTTDQQGRIDEFEKQMLLKAALEREYSRLSMEALQLSETKDKLKLELSWTQGDNKSREKMVHDLESAIVEEAARQHRNWKTSATFRVANRLIARAKVEKTALVLYWKAIANEALVVKVSSPVPKAPYPLNVSDSSEIETFDPVYHEFAEIVFRSRADLTLHGNVLTDIYSMATQQEKPMAAQQIFKTFEEMMARKFDADLADLKAGKLPRGIPDFLFEHMCRSVGLRPLAMKALNQLLPGLQKLYEEEHPYGRLICQILQAFDSDPVHYLLGLYVTRILAQYELMAGRYAKVKAERGSKRGVKQSGAITPRMRKEMKPYLGGDAFLQDVIPLIPILFEGKPRLGEQLFSLLKPENLSVEDYVTFAVCQKMAKLGRSPENLYRLLDPSGVGSIFEGEFVSRLRESLDLWIPEVSLRVLFRSMSLREKRLTFNAFASSINFKAYNGNCTSDDYTLTACDFVTAMMKLFRENEKTFVMRVKQLLDNKLLTEVDRDCFIREMYVLDPTLSATDVEDLWDLAMQEMQVQDRLSPESFALVLTYHPIGTLRDPVFCKLYPDQPEVTDLVLHHSQGSGVNSTSESARSLSPAVPTRTKSMTFS